MWWITTTEAFIAWVGSLPIADRLDLIWQEGSKPAEIYQPWAILMCMLAPVVACVVVSLLTQQVAPEKLKRFYDLTRTPVQEGEVVLRPCTMPVGVESPQRRMLLTAGGLEVPMPSAVSWAGFLAGWVAVAMLVGGFLWIVHGW
jgi:hypothetical protein